MAEFASKGVAGTALGLGIAGTVALAQNIGLLGGDGGLFGGRGNCNTGRGCGAGCNDVSALMSENAMLKSERYTDQQTLDTRDRIAALNKEVIGYVVDLGQKAAVNQANFECLASKVAEISGTVKVLASETADMRVREAETQKDIQCLARTTADRFSATQAETAAAIAMVGQKIDCCCEKQTMSLNCAVDKLRCYADATFVPGKLVMPLSSICPAAKPLCTPTAV